MKKSVLPGLAILLWCFFWSTPSRAQLATSFYNLTGIETRVLPNALQITIRADGSLNFGTDAYDFVDLAEGRFESKTTTFFRLRFAGARSKLPAFVTVGKYPLDSIAVSPGREPLRAQFYASGGDPQTDLIFRFDVPITLRSFQPSNYETLPFGGFLNPLDVSVVKGEDGSSVIITIVPDRVDTRLTPRSGSTPATQIEVQKLADNRLKIRALYAPLGKLLDAVSQQTGVSLASDASVAQRPISLSLPNATLAELFNALQTGYDLFALPLETADGGFRIAGGTPENFDSPSYFERVALNYLAPERARLLFPDFLLPFLKADRENNALLVSGSPRLIARLKRDLSVLDVPRPQVKIVATAWEISDTRDANSALRLLSTFNDGNAATAENNTATGQYSFRVAGDEARRFSLNLEALATRGRARLMVKPFVVVASGERSTLFLGQTRFVPVLQNDGGGQNLRILQLSIGYALNVRPIVGADDNILLEINPRLSTVDSIERGSGLPFLGVRETNGVLRLQSGDSVIVGGLDADLVFDSKRQRFLSSKRSNRNRTSLLILVQATKITDLP